MLSIRQNLLPIYGWHYVPFTLMYGNTTFKFSYAKELFIVKSIINNALSFRFPYSISVKIFNAAITFARMQGEQQSYFVLLWSNHSIASSYPFSPKPKILPAHFADT